jgi:tRNA pseudouridine55 synthase
MGRRQRKGRRISGIVILDKPIGLSSNQALQQVKRLYQAQKAGHTGNLDPLATGVLPICLGEATKVSAYLLDADKRYTATVKLGEQTTTGDAEGEVIARKDVGPVDETQIQAVLTRFLGEIQQLPPMYSALKHQGTPLYKLAEQGIEVERKVRTVTIFDILLIDLQGTEFTMDVYCSKGTYIRTLAEDIAREMGTVAHLTALNRTQAGPFTLEQSYTMGQLAAMAEQGLEALDGCLIPVEQALEHWPRVELSETSAHYIGQGQAVLVAKAPTEGLVCLFGPDQRFLGIGTIQDDGRVAPKRLFHPD